jgi:dolichol-phosphate mannosyltransferase
MARDFDVLVEMDADGSHQPSHLPEMLAALANADVVIGSRWIDGGGVVNWPRRRLLLSRGGNVYIQAMLGLSVHDATAGYRAYRRAALEQMDLDTVNSQGYCFQVDLTRRAAAAGLHIVEVPITFVEREVGESKMSSAIVAEALLRVTAWGIGRRSRQVLLAAHPNRAESP